MDDTILSMQEAVEEAAKLGYQYSRGSLSNAAAAWQAGKETGLKSVKKGKTHLTTLGDLKQWLADPRRGQVGPIPKVDDSPKPKRPRGRPRKSTNLP